MPSYLSIRVSFLVAYFLQLLYFSSYGQSISENYIINPETDSLLVFKREFSSYTILCQTAWKEDQIICFDMEGRYDLTPHESEDDEHFYSPLIVPKEYFNGLRVINKTSKRINLICHYVPKIKDEMPLASNQGPDPCAKPPWVDQQIWRAGLDPPKPNPIFTKVNHNIVHHSAGSNTNPNYTDVVRNIYVFHTKTRGWNDIGYNFLIARNGLIFAGRDPQGAGLQDEVLGAHFCSKNSSTMGICLLGNYSDTTPSVLMLRSLESLLAWKFFNQNKLPTDSMPHPLITDPFLDLLAGHRDGCATQCPGNNVYPLLPLLRQNLLRTVQTCKFNVGISDATQAFSFTVNNGNLTVSDPSAWHSAMVYDISGKLLSNFPLDNEINRIPIVLTKGRPYVFRVRQRNGLEKSMIYFYTLPK